MIKKTRKPNTHSKCDVCHRSLSEIQELDFVGKESTVIGQCEKCGLKVCFQCKSPDMPFGSTSDFKHFIYLENNIHKLSELMCPKCGPLFEKSIRKATFVVSPNGTVSKNS